MNAVALIQILLISVLPVIMAITIHEAAHGYAARHFGDPTAWQAGRISLNPLRHVDPVGTLLVPGVILLTSYLAGGRPMLFGWAKPVPVNFGRLRRPKADMLWVAAAGPAANLVMALAWTALLKVTGLTPADADFQLFAAMCDAGLGVNLVLMVLNLLPLPPLDGGRIMVSLLPMPLAVKFAKIERFGFPILILLLLTHGLDRIIGPAVKFFETLIHHIYLFS